jgi:hypothetical protein
VKRTASSSSSSRRSEARERLGAVTMADPTSSMVVQKRHGCEGLRTRTARGHGCHTSTKRAAKTDLAEKDDLVRKEGVRDEAARDCWSGQSDACRGQSNEIPCVRRGPFPEMRRRAERTLHRARSARPMCALCTRARARVRCTWRSRVPGASRPATLVNESAGARRLRS